MALGDETDYQHKGVIDFADNTVDPETGTIRIRAAAGDKSVVHEHPSNVSVQLNDSATEKAGTVQWHPGPEKHGGDPSTQPAALDVIVVELKSGAGALPK